MPVYIYNTLSKKKELFEPAQPGKVRMYVCGPTVYDSCHIGHARSVIVFDVIARYFRSQGYEVTYVRNFTDVDDKIINRAAELGVESQEVAERYINEFYEDMGMLNVENATKEPRATEHIDDIIEMIEILIEKGHAYIVDSDVYYSVESFSEYGKLSGRRLEDMMAGARVDVDKRKRNPFDFALWKSAKPNEPFWKSPWGEGRPGWHIECSAMSGQYLGKTFDIHGGGKDLIFPHHENEIAQSEGAFGQTFVKYWVHNGFVNIDHEKMSKSLGNFLMIKDIVKLHHPEAIRLFLLSNHYRSPIDYTEKAMEEAGAGLDKIYALLERVKEKYGVRSEIGNDNSKDCWMRFCEAMDDDFNTAQGIGVIFDAVRNLNRRLDAGAASNERESLQLQAAEIIKMGRVIGILNETPDDYFNEKQARELEKRSIDPADIEEMVIQRDAARKEKNWEKADQIRKQLADMNIVLQDRPEGTVWRFARG